jgi:hypothetical protein
MCWATALLCGQPKKAHGCLRTTESRGHPPRRRHRGARCKHTSVSIGDSNADMGFDHPVDRVVIVEGLAGPERSSTDDVEGLAGPKLGRRQTLPAAGLHIVGAGRVRLHSQTESAFNKSLHTDQRRNLYCWHACVRVRASIFHPRKYIGLSPRRPCGSATTELIRPAGAGLSVLAARPTTLLLVFEHLKISNSFFLQARDSNEMNSPNANSTCCICGQHSTCYITFNMLYLWTAFNML